ncbi:sodium:proton antiporter [Bacillaceae bacterium S4-13-58]
MNRILSMIMIILSFGVLWKYKYRILSTVLSVGVIRKLGIRFAFRWPKLRSAMMGSVFGTSPQTKSY